MAVCDWGQKSSLQLFGSDQIFASLPAFRASAHHQNSSVRAPENWNGGKLATCAVADATVRPSLPPNARPRCPQCPASR